MMIGRSINLSALFKFHYDSINSMKELEMKEDLNEFKFHYDSINSMEMQQLQAQCHLI